MSENIHKGHRERMRKKFIQSGFDGFTNHEILELLLFYSRPRIDTNAIAHRLIDKYKTISGVCNADIEDLKEIEGIDEASAVLIKMIPLLAKEYMNSSSNSIHMSNYNTVCEYFKTQFLGETVEKIRIACLDDKLRLISGKIIAEGAPGGVGINIRRIVEFTYKNKCENVILAHNHPDTPHGLPASRR